ncbi:MAG TPA: hypothetical protein PLX77_03775 [Candidatus Cloacimonadota bacterium]|nr:hypothetical protein [Candidatus Cloacimonadota bacterium]
MKRYLAIISIVIFLMGMFGCATTGAGGEKMIVKYDIELTMVRSAVDINQRYRAPVADTTTTDVTRYTYEDDLFRSIWSATEAGWDLVLYNKSEKPIMIDWNNVNYQDVDNIGHKVLISSTRFTDRDKDQVPSVIVRRGNLTEKLVSATHIYQSPLSGLLVKRPMFPIDYNEAIRYKGKEFKLMIPFTVDGLSSQYEFVFKIKDVRQVSATSNPWASFLMDRALGATF